MAIMKVKFLISKPIFLTSIGTIHLLAKLDAMHIQCAVGTDLKYYERSTHLQIG